ncbi:hypothetical protein FACS189475_05280 [Betaproteobacteria bacterium]|nr:hypothetical protein FACS189475_05280 [Betaproteobacteria bacterium]
MEKIVGSVMKLYKINNKNIVDINVFELSLNLIKNIQIKHWIK